MKLSGIFCTLGFCLVFVTASAQLSDSLKRYVISGVAVIQKESLYSKKLNWTTIRAYVNRQLEIATTQRQAESILINVFDQLKDDHGFYGGIDTSYRYRKPGPERTFSQAILAEYKKPRAIKIVMLDNGIAYYKMPAVLIGSNQEKMKQWANMLSDSLCKLEAGKPRGYIIDLRMNNGGNIEPMWHSFKGLVGEHNRTFIADASGRILPEEKDSVSVKYKLAAFPDRTCSLRSHIPVAVLIGPGTASSGEIMALSFTTRANTKLFGEPSIGVASVTNGFTLQDKGYLLLTVGYLADARKKILKTCQVRPDVFVKSEDNYDSPDKDVTVQAAARWLNAYIK